MKRIGILGGTFNPIHNGHVYIAKQAMEAFSFDELWVMPAGIPPHKRIAGDISPHSRRMLCEAAVADEPKMRVISEEIYKATPSYTFETLQKFHAEFPQDEFYFIIGEDSLDSFAHWVHPEIIASLATIVVAVRNDENRDYHSLEAKARALAKEFSGRFELIPSENIPISSTMLRERLLQGQSVAEFVPSNAVTYMQEHHLYEAHMEDNEELRKDITKDLKKNLKKSRFEHTMGVMYTCCALAMRYDYPMVPARFAGLLHDVAKYLSDEEQLAFCKKHDIPVTAAEKQAPYLLHAKIGAYMACHEYEITDEEVLHAITVHTTGAPQMNLLDKILFTADYIEPNRKEAPRLDVIRATAFEDLDRAVLMILEDSIRYINETNRPMDETTLATYEYYKNTVAPKR